MQFAGCKKAYGVEIQKNIQLGAIQNDSIEKWDWVELGGAWPPVWCVGHGASIYLGRNPRIWCVLDEAPWRAGQ